MKNLKLNYSAIFSVYTLMGVLVIVAPLLVIFQVWFMNQIAVNNSLIKIFISLVLTIVGFVTIKNLFTMGPAIRNVLIAYFAFFTFVSLSILIHSVPINGLDNSLGAVSYYFSLFPFLIPVLYLPLRTFHNAPKVCVLILGSLVGISMIFAIIQFIFNSYIYPPFVVEYLLKADAIRFSNLQGIIRSFGFFKSPLELGIISSFMGILAVRVYYYSKKLGNIAVVMFILSALSALTTGSRTAFIIYFFAMLAHLYFLLKDDYKKLYKLKAYLVLPAIGLLFALQYLYIHGDFAMSQTEVAKVPAISATAPEAFANPRNLIIRLENWARIFNGLDQEELIFGKGVVQNGRFQTNAMEIDNLYIAVILASGLIGLALFIVTICFFFRYFLFKAEEQYVVTTSFLIGFLLGGMTENMMHLMYFVLICYLLEKALLHSDYFELEYRKNANKHSYQ